MSTRPALQPDGRRITFVHKPIEGVQFRTLNRHADERGWLIELYRLDELSEHTRPQMAYISSTSPGITRGPHEHVDQTDLFGFFGPGDFRLYLWDTRRDSPTYGHRQVVTVGESNKQAVMIPPGVVHAYQNVSMVSGLIFNAPNRLYAGEGRRGPVDEIRHENDPSNPFVLD